MFMGLRRSFSGEEVAGQEPREQTMSNRQRKLEKRGGQKVVYRS